MKKLSVVIPSFNESERIAKTLFSVSDFLKNQPYESEIIVMSDGSTDQTVQVVNSLKNQITNLSVVDNQENHGKGWVTKQGMLLATGDIRVFMDADNSTKIDEINKFLPCFEQGFDVVIGSRRTKGSVIATHQGFVRDFLGGVFRLIVHTLVPLGVADSQCGFKAFTAKSAEQIFSRQSIYRWAFDVEILAIGTLKGFKIKEMPITWVNDGASHVKFSGMVNMLLEVLKIRWNLWTGQYKKSDTLQN